MQRTDVVVWFEIPASDFQRAVRFYESLFETTSRRSDMGPLTMAVLPYEKPGVSGCIVAGPHYQPGADGPVVYLNCDGRLDAMAARVESLGGHLHGPKIELPPGMGAFQLIVDSEGNRIGLHSQ